MMRNKNYSVWFIRVPVALSISVGGYVVWYALVRPPFVGFYAIADVFFRIALAPIIFCLAPLIVSPILGFIFAQAYDWLGKMANWDLTHSIIQDTVKWTLICAVILDAIYVLFWAAQMIYILN
jgi:hypothetical protein